jgi:hypothetical protein
MDVRSLDFAFPRLLVDALVADDLALQGSFEGALDLTIWPITHPPFDDLRRKDTYAIGSMSLPPLKP